MSDRQPTILLAEDDDNDSWFFEVAFDKSAHGASLVRVRDCVRAMDYLCGTGAYSDRQKHPFPRLIILALQAGLEVLEWFQKQPESSLVPVIILSDCGDPAVIRRAFSLGANSYLIKPREYDRYVRMVWALKEYWLGWNQPPALEQEQSSRIFADPLARPELLMSDSKIQA